MLVLCRHPEPADRVAFEVEFDQHYGLLADDPAVVTRLDSDDLRSFVFDDAAIGIFDVNLPTREKTSMGMHAVLGADNWLHHL